MKNKRIVFTLAAVHGHGTEFILKINVQFITLGQYPLKQMKSSQKKKIW